MTIIEGQIESLKSIKDTLRKNGISRFNSIGGIRSFLKNYEDEKMQIQDGETQAYNLELKDLQKELSQAQNVYNDLKKSESEKLDSQIAFLKSRNRTLQEKYSRNFVTKIFYLLPYKLSRSKIGKLEKNYQRIIAKLVKDDEEKVSRINDTIEERTKKREKILFERTRPRIDELNSIKKVVDELDTLIAGTVGEDLVVNELEKLSDECVLFNDFSLKFDPPIYNKKERDRISSIQIDHLLVTNSGIFVLETKNWSQESIEKLSLRSPVKQIMRTSYALFVVFNSESKRNKSLLKRHHWGEKQVPIRNIVVMIKEKPKESFQYVKVKTLNELNGYVTHFQRIFDGDEVRRIADHLRKIRG